MHKLIELRDCARAEVMDHIEHHCDCYKEFEEYIITCKMIHGLNIMDEYIERHSHEVEYVSEPNEVHELSMQCIKDWVASMGEHWTLEQTSSVVATHKIEFTHLRKIDWYATMNMVYSDYYKESYTVDDYAFIAKKFLFDADGYSPKEKLYRYWKFVAKHD